MNDLMNERKGYNDRRRGLLTTVSGIALIGLASSFLAANAAEDDRDPQIWIELGGQLSRVDEGQEAFSPLLMDNRPSMFSPPDKFEGLPNLSIEESGKVFLQPHDSDWVFSASVRYGSSASRKQVKQQAAADPFKKYYTSSGQRKTHSVLPSAEKFAETSGRTSDQHLVVDFQAGKDVGLGMFGSMGGSSTVSLGVRFAQFGAQSNLILRSDPDWKFQYKYYAGQKIVFQSNNGHFHSNTAKLIATRSFHGVGPSLSWSASQPLLGGKDRGEINLDWGLNAAILFGRQKANTAHYGTEIYKPGGTNHKTVITQYSHRTSRRHSVTVPNVGGFAGVTYRIEDFKISAGYRADLFFGAMDGGIDAAKKESVGFYGPFASVSVGLGG